MAKTKRPNQGDTLRKFGTEVVSYYVGESALSPGTIQIGQYSSKLVGTLTPAQARELAAALVAAADAVDKSNTNS